MSKKEKTYEEALLELEGIVKKLEGGNFSLEESLTLYEKGVALTKYCADKLQEAEKKIRILAPGPDGEMGEEEFILAQGEER